MSKFIKFDNVYINTGRIDCMAISMSEIDDDEDGIPKYEFSIKIQTTQGCFYEAFSDENDRDTRLSVILTELNRNYW